MEQDSSLLAEQKLMDYSLLFAVEYTEEEWVSQKYLELENRVRKNAQDSPDSSFATGSQFFNSIRKKKKSLKMTKEQRMIQNEESPYKYYSECGKFIYHLAIIDYLQEFNYDK